jgi:methionine-rich copper-binding protein CopC
MLGTQTHAANTALPVSAAFQAMANGALELGFQVEEEEMFVDLEMEITFSNAVGERTDFTFFVDNQDIEQVGVNGIHVETDNNIHSFQAKRTIRLPQGYHTVEWRVKAPTGVVTVQGGIVPCRIHARRHSHPATLGHGVDSKVQLVQ